MIERRKEPRYPIPEIYQKDITLKINLGPDKFVPAKVLNVSLSGIKIGDQVELAVGSVIDCSIYIPKLFTQEALFSAKVSYCIEDKDLKYYFIGAETSKGGGESWVKIFFKVHDFISQEIRGGAQNLPA
jgi:PilZ domain